MRRFALVMTLSLLAAVPAAAQNRGETPDRNEAPIVAPVFLPAAVTVSPRPQPAPRGPRIVRAKRPFMVPWMTGVYQ